MEPVPISVGLLARPLDTSLLPPTAFWIQPLLPHAPRGLFPRPAAPRGTQTTATMWLFHSGDRFSHRGRRGCGSQYSTCGFHCLGYFQHRPQPPCGVLTHLAKRMYLPFPPRPFTAPSLAESPLGILLPIILHSSLKILDARSLI